MREIKFRAWDKKGKVWLEWGFFDLFQILKNDRYVVVQYTGLLDKKGKEIYEGDIVQGITTVYENDGWRGKELVNAKVEITEAGVRFNREPFHKYSKYEVIGNIYENPELIT